MALTIPGTMNIVYGSWGTLGSSTTFTFYGPDPGFYDVILQDNEYSTFVNRASSRSISTGTNAISWSAFAAVPPCITITATEIPAEYRNGFGLIEFEHTTDWAFYSTDNIGATATFRFWFVAPGTYDLQRLLIEGSDRWGEAFVPARNITTTTIIPWSDFYFFMDGEVMSITVTGIPERYHGTRWGRLALSIPGTENFVGVSMETFVNASTTFRLRDVESGIFDVSFWPNGNRYTLSSRNLFAGASISFGEFTLAESRTLSEPTERSGQTSPARSNARPLRPHR